LQCITYQKCGGLIVLLVAGRFAATQVVIVHTRHIIMNQRIGVNQLHAGSGNI
jgi:hypothetical protein